MRNTCSHSNRRAVTLTEMLVVTGVVVLVLSLALPAFTIWESRKVQDAINQVSGVVKAAQSRAMSDNTEIGLFFYIDPRTATQCVLPIAPALDASSPMTTAERFRLRDTDPFKLPKPMRVTPFAVLDDGCDDEDPLCWSPEQLADDNLRNVPDNASITIGTPIPYDPDNGDYGTQYHRNFFVILFRPDGSIAMNRRIVIWDGDPEPSVSNLGDEQPGFRTGLTVSSFANIVTDAETRPISFAPTRGVIIYRNDTYDLFAEEDPGLLRPFLEREGDPLFIHPRTGQVIKGQPGDAV